VAGYDPARYLAAYESAEGRTYQEKLNSLRRAHYAENRKKITAQKRAAYAARKGSTIEDEDAKIKTIKGTMTKQVLVLPVYSACGIAKVQATGRGHVFKRDAIPGVECQYKGRSLFLGNRGASKRLKICTRKISAWDSVLHFIVSRHAFQNAMFAFTGMAPENAKNSVIHQMNLDGVNGTTVQMLF